MRTTVHEDEDKKQQLSQRRRILRERFASNSIPDKEFIYKYRLSRELFNKLCAEITPLLPQLRPDDLDPNIKILAVLHFYAWGPLQLSTDKNVDMLTNQTMSRCIREVTNAITHNIMLQRYITFPRNKEERDVIKKRFFEKFGFPDVIGCMDCNHLAITKPAENEAHYRNYHNYHSILARIICDADCNILGVNASSVGAYDYTDVWFDDPISAHLNTLDDTETTYLIGNSNFNLDEHLMIPIADVTENTPESRYNDLHQTVYATIDQTLYKLKSRWRCLLSRKELNYEPSMAARILIACAILHNMCNMAGLEAPEMSEIDLEEERQRQDGYSDVSCYSYDEEYRVKLVQVIEENRLKAIRETMEVTCGNTEATCSNTTETMCGSTMEATCSNTTEATCSYTTEPTCSYTMEAPSSNTNKAKEG